MNDHRRLERFLGIRLPASLADALLRLHEERIDPWHRPHMLYARIHAPAPAYDDLARALETTPVAESDLRFLLPGKWKLPATLTLDWWTPSVETPDNARACPFGAVSASGDAIGWVLMQHYDDAIFLRAFAGQQPRDGGSRPPIG